MVDKRPININPLSIKLPVTAWISIAHRISGIFVFLLIPLFLWVLQQSLASSLSYKSLTEVLNWWCMKSLIFVLLGSLIFHFIAGIRHLFLDMHLGESLRGGRLTSYLTFVISIVVILAVALRLWG